MTATALIGVDWGTTALRAYRLAHDGRLLDCLEAPAGILQVEAGDFEAAFARTLAPWLAELPDSLPMIASGMITSRQGWRETPYLACPCDVAALADALTPHRTAAGRRIWFVTGLSRHDSSGTPDVLRGEETQIVGCLAAGQGDGLFVLPGTHSKWARATGGAIDWFATFMTGELYGALKDHTILGRLMSGDGPAPEAFERGLRFGLDDGPEAGGLLRRLFSARSLGLFGEVEPAALADYLSGLLIGAEAREALAAWPGAGGEGLTLVGQGALVDRYAKALDLAGCRTRRAKAEVAADGLFAIAKAAGLLS